MLSKLLQTSNISTVLFKVNVYLELCINHGMKTLHLFVFVIIIVTSC